MINKLVAIIGAVSVEFKLVKTGETFTWELDNSNSSFIGGNEYIFDVELTRTGVNVLGTIQDWITITQENPVVAD